MSVAAALSAPIELSFPYTRSLGPTLGRFMTALAGAGLVGVRTSDGRVHVPPVEFDPLTHEAVTDFVEVADEGEVVSWSWAAEPLPGQPLDHPFAWVLVRLDGADTTLLHALDVASPADVSTGLRVRARWRDERAGAITDIACFERATGERAFVAAGEVDDVTITTTPIELKVLHTASLQETRYLQGLEHGRLL